MNKIILIEKKPYLVSNEEIQIGDEVIGSDGKKCYIKGSSNSHVLWNPLFTIII